MKKATTSCSNDTYVDRSSIPPLPLPLLHLELAVDGWNSSPLHLILLLLLLLLQ